MELSFIPYVHSKMANFKTNFCRAVKCNEICNFGVNCKFAHRDQELRNKTDPIPVFAKMLYSPNHFIRAEWKDIKNVEQSSQLADNSHIQRERDEYKDIAQFYQYHYSEAHHAAIDIKRELEKTISANLKTKDTYQRQINEKNAKIEVLEAEMVWTQEDASEYLKKLWRQAEKFHKLREKLLNVEQYNKRLQAKVHELKKLTLDIPLQADQNGNSHMFYVMLKKLKGELECPIMLDLFQNPKVLPSGNTVSEWVFKRLHSDFQLDPFDKNCHVVNDIPNLALSKIQEIVNDASDKFEKSKESTDGSTSNNAYLPCKCIEDSSKTKLIQAKKELDKFKEILISEKKEKQKLLQLLEVKQTQINDLRATKGTDSPKSSKCICFSDQSAQKRA